MVVCVENGILNRNAINMSSYALRFFYLKDRHLDNWVGCGRTNTDFGSFGDKVPTKLKDFIIANLDIFSTIPELTAKALQ